MWCIPIGFENQNLLKHFLLSLKISQLCFKLLILQNMILKVIFLLTKKVKDLLPRNVTFVQSQKCSWVPIIWLLMFWMYIRELVCQIVSKVSKQSTHFILSAIFCYLRSSSLRNVIILVFIIVMMVVWRSPSS